jgi:hypothetical protein
MPRCHDPHRRAGIDKNLAHRAPQDWFLTKSGRGLRHLLHHLPKPSLDPEPGNPGEQFRPDGHYLRSACFRVRPRPSGAPFPRHPGRPNRRAYKLRGNNLWLIFDSAVY